MATYDNLLVYKASYDLLQDIPGCNYTGRHHKKVQKHEAFALKMRKYASESVEGNPRIKPYYLALPEWVRPIVCYHPLPKIKKRLSMYVCGMLCENVYEGRKLNIR